MVDGAAAEEEKRLEEGVREQVEDGGHIPERTERQHHVAELTDGGIRHHAFEVGLNEGDAGGKQCRNCADPGNHFAGVARGLEDREESCDEVHAGGDHGGRVDERGDRRRTFHRVRKPYVQRELGRLTRSTGEDAQREKRDDRCRGHVARHVSRGPFLDGRHIEVTRFAEDEKQCREEAEVANASDDERLLRGSGGAGFVEPEADEQVRAKTNQFPEDEYLEEVVGEDEAQHREREQTHVGEVATFAFVAVHVSGGIQLDEHRNAGDDDEHDCRQAVNANAEVHGQRPGGEPLVGVLANAAIGVHDVE